MSAVEFDCCRIITILSIEINYQILFLELEWNQDESSQDNKVKGALKIIIVGTAIKCWLGYYRNLKIKSGELLFGMSSHHNDNCMKERVGG